MDLKQLKFLIALDETRHFGQAAARCHITVSYTHLTLPTKRIV